MAVFKLHPLPSALAVISVGVLSNTALAGDLPDGRYNIHPVNSGKCVDVAYASTADGANVAQVSCNGNDAQVFDVIDTGGGWYRMINYNSGKAIDVAGGSTADNANVQQWTDNGTGAQRFAAVKVSGNQYKLVNKNSGKCVDVYWGNTADGTNILQYSCTGQSNQLFTFSPVGAVASGSTMQSGQVLNPGSKITSPNGVYTFAYQSDGNLVLRKGSTTLWSSGTLGQPVGVSIMQPDGNLVVYGSKNRPLWASNTWGQAGNRLTVQNDGNVVINNTSGQAVWATNTAQPTTPPPPTAQGSTIQSGQVLNVGQSINSPNGTYRLTYQPDGNVVLYKGSAALWASGTNGKSTGVTIMQPDGNLVIYDNAGHAVWASNTWGQNGNYMKLQDDGNFVMYHADGSPAWATNTAQSTPTSSDSIASIRASSIPMPPGNGSLSLKVMNGTNGAKASSNIYWGVIGIDPVTSSWSYLDMNGNLIPISAGLNDAPGHLTKNGVNYANIYHKVSETGWANLPKITSGRMFLCVDSPCYIKTYNDGFAGPNVDNPTDPNRDIYFDFIEFTVNDSGYHGNTTRVDGFGFPIQMRLVNQAGNYDRTVGELESETRAGIFSEYQNEVPSAFKSLAQIQAPYRIVAPLHGSFAPGGANQYYFSGYAPYSNTDILGGENYLAQNPQIDAAINRHVYTDSANWNNPGAYYQAGPANYYAKFWHDHNIGRLAYGFPYDDVNGQASYLEIGAPKGLIVRVGW